MREGLVIGDVGTHPRDESWDAYGMADEMRRLHGVNIGPPLEDGGRAIAAAPGTGAEAEAGQLMVLDGLEEEVVGGDTAEQGEAEEV